MVRQAWLHTQNVSDGVANTVALRIILVKWDYFDQRKSLNAFTEITRNMNWKDHIAHDPDICHGKPCIIGTRVMVSVILDNLAAGVSFEDIQRGYFIEAADIQAALLYAAELARDRVINLPKEAA